MAANYRIVFCGGVLGAIFTLLGLPIPAPPVLAGIMGIVGVFVGYVAINFFMH